MRNRRMRLVWTGIAVAVLLLPVALAGAGGTEAIQKRIALMEETGKAMGQLGAIAKNKAPFDAEVVRTSGREIAKHLEEFAKLFPEGSQTGEVQTWAKAEIWSDRETFDKIVKASVAAAGEMQAVEEEAAFLPALGGLGNTCKTCHDKFRSPQH